MEEWLQQLLLQVPFACVVIYFMLKHGDQDAKERQERNREWAEEARQRDAQWREFLQQRDERWIGLLDRMNEAYTMTNAAIVKQQEATGQQLKALAVEIKAAQVKLAQMEQFIVLSLGQWIERKSRAKPRAKPQEVKS
ncbi:MAG: hypothetical protein JXA21_20790 [Anaerolineae bacterium]|nr:hypothetical protein [Anaerolineae bacterium]